MVSLEKTQVSYIFLIFSGSPEIIFFSLFLMHVITSAIKSTVTFKTLPIFLCSFITASFTPINVISATWPLLALSFNASSNWLYTFLFNKGFAFTILLSLSLKSVIIVSYAIFAPFKNSF